MKKRMIVRRKLQPARPHPDKVVMQAPGTYTVGVDLAAGGDLVYVGTDHRRVVVNLAPRFGAVTVFDGEGRARAHMGPLTEMTVGGTRDTGEPATPSDSDPRYTALAQEMPRIPRSLLLNLGQQLHDYIRDCYGSTNAEIRGAMWRLFFSGQFRVTNTTPHMDFMSRDGQVVNRIAHGPSVYTLDCEDLHRMALQSLGLRF